MLPYDEAINTTNLTLVLTNGLGDKRTIVAPKNLPLERNKVTLVKIYVLSGGQIIESGNHTDLMAQHGEYAKMFSLQSKSYREEGKYEN